MLTTSSRILSSTELFAGPLFAPASAQSSVWSAPTFDQCRKHTCGTYASILSSHLCIDDPFYVLNVFKFMNDFAVDSMRWHNARQYCLHIACNFNSAEHSLSIIILKL